ncbi:CLUMA_CG002718, isoform A [Clunio marinus]|uniref:CLUMA_CG002718, isoform A n=1 Tax=Clunio marinus TaxID=568069 RepID=A0A1J1HR29_9DIPT|nr:CLUMA_CG002718, isoform A [Clunio marinus]
MCTDISKSQQQQKRIKISKENGRRQKVFQEIYFFISEFFSSLHTNPINRKTKKTNMMKIFFSYHFHPKLVNGDRNFVEEDFSSNMPTFHVVQTIASGECGSNDNRNQAVS